VPVPPAAVEVLRALVGVLPRWGPWYLFGAQAVVAYGVPRLSADVDVTLRLTPDSPERFADDMRLAGFELRLEDEFLTRARLLDIEGLRVPTIDPEDLIIAKVLAGRPKDLGDARGLWQARGREMDAPRIASVLRLLEEALGQSDLTPAFEAIRRRD
jgi:uncharacterized nucleotidyltransferase DUF6036